MARKVKVSDDQIVECLKQGMKQKEIAERYKQHPTTICNRIKSLKASGALDYDKGMEDVTMFNVMDTVVRKNDRKWFRIVAQEDVFFELRPTDQSQSIGNKKNIDVHIKDLRKNYIKKDYPEVKVYNINDPEEKKEDKPMDYNEAVKKPQGVQVKNSTPVVEEKVPAITFEQAEKTFSVKREYLHRIDNILEAVGAVASDEIMGVTLELVVHIIEEGIKKEK